MLLYSGFDGWWCKGNEKFLFEHQRIKLGLVSIKNQTWGLVGFQFRFSLRLSCQGMELVPVSMGGGVIGVLSMWLQFIVTKSKCVGLA
jgi:hypothetical protein